MKLAWDKMMAGCCSICWLRSIPCCDNAPRWDSDSQRSILMNLTRQSPWDLDNLREEVPCAHPWEFLCFRTNTTSLIGLSKENKYFEEIFQITLSIRDSVLPDCDIYWEFWKNDNSLLWQYRILIKLQDWSIIEECFFITRKYGHYKCPSSLS